eukprot:1793934-Amphidinium_carterae.1
MSLSPDGTLRQHEISGPATVGDWEASYRVLRTALIQLDAVCPSHLDLYRDHVLRLHSRYGPQCWMLIYQADVRCRKEHMSRMRLRFTQQLEMGGAPQGFVSERPWNFIWKAVVDDPFWQTQVREPALLILNGSTSMAAHIGGDAPTRASMNKAPAQAQFARSPAAPATPIVVQSSAETRTQKSRRQHLLDESGLHRANRRGIPLCKGFQDGSCTAVQEGTRV